MPRLRGDMDEMSGFGRSLQGGGGGRSAWWGVRGVLAGAFAIASTGVDWGMRNVTVNSIGEYIREQREQAKISMRQLAQSAGESNPYLSQIERGLRKPSADILQQIAKGLRISAEALYVQARSWRTARPTRGPVRPAGRPGARRTAEAGAHRDLRVVPPGERGGRRGHRGRGHVRTPTPLAELTPARRAPKRTRWKPPLEVEARGGSGSRSRSRSRKPTRQTGNP